ncbi:MAG: hypothetical protein OXG35_32425 [Acidobacteria bacterium]|nr:hypothetical protein [Acidobacteriota bacterium]
MKARNKHTKAQIVAESVELLGRAAVTGFERTADGRLVWQTPDGTDVDWDSASTRKDEQGRCLLIDADGEVIPESDVELDIDLYEDGDPSAAPCDARYETVRCGRPAGHEGYHEGFCTENDVVLQWCPATPTDV